MESLFFLQVFVVFFLTFQALRFRRQICELQSKMLFLMNENKIHSVDFEDYVDGQIKLKLKAGDTVEAKKIAWNCVADFTRIIRLFPKVTTRKATTHAPTNTDTSNANPNASN